MPKKKISKILVILLLILLGLILWKRDSFLQKNKISMGPAVDQSEIYQGVSYESIEKDKFDVSIVASNLLSPTRVKITPDQKHLVVTQLTGDVLGFNRVDNGWSAPYLITKIDTKFPGFPPDEAGLVGITFSNDYLNNKKIFALYTFKDKESKVQNRISSFTVKEKGENLVSSRPKMIFQANIPGNVSHQITDGVPINLNGENRIAFLIGEGFDSKRSQDANLHAGKLMSIREDGKDPKIHALGIRNGYSLAPNPKDEEGRILISDTGPDKYDRLIYTNPFLSEVVNFGWDGKEDNLAKPVPDPNFPDVRDMVIFRYRETRTFTGLAFKENGDVLVTLFGKTGFKDNTPGKEILIGRINNLKSQPDIILTPIIRRVKDANGKLGNPLGMEIDKEKGDFFFLDVIEGRLYQVKEKQEGVSEK